MVILMPRLCFNGPGYLGAPHDRGRAHSASTLWFSRTAYARVMKLDTCINQLNTNSMTATNIW